MKVKFVQTRLYRYSVVIEAESLDEADNHRFDHEEWNEDGVEVADPPWREDCPADAKPDVYVVHGYAIPAFCHNRPVKEGMVGCDGSSISVGSRVMCKRGKWDGAPWYPATVTYLYDTGRGRGLDALVQEDDRSKKPNWVLSDSIRIMQPQDVLVVPDEADDDLLDGEVEYVEEDVFENVDPLSEEEVLALDAGVRDLVVALRQQGFNTTDSGDGVSKPEEARELEYPHVFMVVPDYMIRMEAQRLQRWVDANEDLGGWVVQVSYSPKDDVALVSLCRHD